MKNKKGQLGSLESLVIGLVVVGIVLVVGFNILSQLYTAQTTSVAQTATNTTIEAMAGIPSWLSIIVVVGVAAVILGFVSAFARRA